MTARPGRWARLVRLARLALPAVAALGCVAAAALPASAAGSHALIEGSGSSWSANAVNQWVADVQPSGLRVVYTSVGSATGRKDFANGTTDFAVSDIGYQGNDPLTGATDRSDRPYVYVPIVAGGTSFPYQVRVAGKLVRDLRLSGTTLAKIFTNNITNWADPAITADNNGRQLPSLPIIPVVHSEGAGSTAQFTQYLATVHRGIWQAFAGSPDFTEYFPAKGPQTAVAGSDSVMNFLSSAAANGAIGYDEYSYALGKDYPVAKIENTAGYFTAPTQYNVAVALTQAHINMDKASPDYLLQDLRDVYVYGDPRTYPLSSYSYGIIPPAPDDARMTTAKRQTLADFLFYSTCEGQAEMGPIGYSPLPVNLVQASFDQTALLAKADPGVNITEHNVRNCQNPTFDPNNPSANRLAEIAPPPPECDKVGQGPCAPNAGVVNANPVGGTAPAAVGGSASAGGSAGAGGGGAGPGGAGRGPAAGRSGSAGPSGGDGAAGSGGGAAEAAGAAAAGATPEEVAAAAGSEQALAPLDRSDPLSGLHGVLAALAVLFVVLVLVAPPVVFVASGRRSSA